MNKNNFTNQQYGKDWRNDRIVPFRNIKGRTSSGAFNIKLCTNCTKQITRQNSEAKTNLTMLHKSGATTCYIKPAAGYNTYVIHKFAFG